MLEINKDEARRRRDLDQATADRNLLQEKLADQDRVVRNAKAALLSTTQSETWHRMSLGWLDRDAGYAGEMAAARVWCRNLPMGEYVDTLKPFADNMPDAPNLAIEFAAVSANLNEWTQKGKHLLLDRAKREYQRELAAFDQWQLEHPSDDSWRKKHATRAQWFLIDRTAMRLNVEMPVRLNRGAAYDWLGAHGGNLRLCETAPKTHDEPTTVARSGEAGDRPPPPLDLRATSTDRATLTTTAPATPHHVASEARVPSTSDQVSLLMPHDGINAAIQEARSGDSGLQTDHQRRPDIATASTTPIHDPRSDT